MEKIRGDGTNGLAWRHRDIGNAKVYDSNNYDIVNNFDFSSLETDREYTIFLTFNDIDSGSGGGVLFSNSDDFRDSSYFRIILNDTGFFGVFDASNDIYARIVVATTVNYSKRNNITIKKEPGRSAENFFFFINGISAGKIIYQNTKTNNTIIGNEAFLCKKQVFPTDGRTNISTNLAKLSIVNYAQSDEEIARDAALGYQQSTNGLFLLNVDFNKTTGDDLTDTSPNNYTITSTGNKNFAPFY